MHAIFPLADPPFIIKLQQTQSRSRLPSIVLLRAQLLLSGFMLAVSLCLGRADAEFPSCAKKSSGLLKFQPYPERDASMQRSK